MDAKCTADPATIADGSTTIGLAQLMGLAYKGVDLTPIWQLLLDRLNRDAGDAAALMDLSTIMLLTGQRERGLEVQDVALQLRHCYRRPHGEGSGLRVLALMAPGDMMANTPLDFLLEGSNIELILLYLLPGQPVPSVLPPHDVCFLAVGESTENLPILGEVQRWLRQTGRRVLNGRPDRIADLTRDAVCAAFAHDPDVAVAATVRVTRTALETLSGTGDMAALLPGVVMPITVRPVGTHAGQGLASIEQLDQLVAYLRERPEPEFYLAPFVDYRSADGSFRKLRVVFICGSPYLSHMAISEHWVVHYLSAGMAESEAKRAEEARLFATFDEEFVPRHRAALDGIARRVGLDYFGIDCAELPDGRLLLFEVDVALIVHALDPVETFPYKRPRMAELFAAFQAMLQAATSDRNVVAQRQREREQPALAKQESVAAFGK